MKLTQKLFLKKYFIYTFIIYLIPTCNAYSQVDCFPKGFVLTTGYTANNINCASYKGNIDFTFHLHDGGNLSFGCKYKLVIPQSIQNLEIEDQGSFENSIGTEFVTNEFMVFGEGLEKTFKGTIIDPSLPVTINYHFIKSCEGEDDVICTPDPLIIKPYKIIDGNVNLSSLITPPGNLLLPVDDAVNTAQSIWINGKLIVDIDYSFLAYNLPFF